MSWTPADFAQLASMAEESHYGYHDGQRQLNLRTQYETAAWRALAGDHDAARRRLNDLLPPTATVRARAPEAAFLGDYRSFNSPLVQGALRDYRAECVKALGAAGERPRRILTYIWIAAELAGASDPVWSATSWGKPASASNFVFNRLYRQTERALKAGGLA